jgi:uncharacterized SAM-dependent methyltransferase
MNILREVITGLSQPQKILPGKILFDKKGLETFENATEIFRNQQPQVLGTELPFNFFSSDSYLIEPDCDGSKDVHFFLQESRNLLAYFPVSPSPDILTYRMGDLKALFPNLKTIPLQVDFRVEEDFYFYLSSLSGRKILFASSLMTSRSSPAELFIFLRKALRNLGSKTSFVFAFISMTSETQDQISEVKEDLWENFNYHALERLNNEASADFNLYDFRFETLFDKQKKRTDFHLVSKVDQFVKVNQSLFKIKKDESIQTLSLFNHSLEDLEDICQKVKIKINRSWTTSDSFMTFYELIK